MTSLKKRRVSAWSIFFSLLWLGSAASAVRVLQQPDAQRFFLFWIEVGAGVASVGCAVALMIVAFRKMAGSAAPDTRHRMF
jgi:hypothetical protein